MSSQKTSNNDSCRDLTGRRLSTIKEAKKCVDVFYCFCVNTLITVHWTVLRVMHRLAEYLEQEPARKKAAAEAQRAKLEALERRLGIDKDAGPSSGGDSAQVAGKKHRFDDTEYLEQSRELVDNVKSAVTAGEPPFSLFFFCSRVNASPLLGLLKKRKKTKTGPSLAKQETPKTISQEAPEAPPLAVSSQASTQEISVVDMAAVGA